MNSKNALRNEVKFGTETLSMRLNSAGKPAKIPTTFIPLAPERIAVHPALEVDLLCGVFHIMWQDMPTPRSYGVKLKESISSEGIYLGCFLACTFPEEKSISCKVN